METVKIAWHFKCMFFVLFLLLLWLREWEMRDNRLWTFYKYGFICASQVYNNNLFAIIKNTTTTTCHEINWHDLLRKMLQRHSSTETLECNNNNNKNNNSNSNSNKNISVISFNLQNKSNLSHIILYAEHKQ